MDQSVKRDSIADATPHSRRREERRRLLRRALNDLPDAKPVNRADEPGFGWNSKPASKQ